MIHGVKINGTDTLTTYGLMVLADISEGSPALKTAYVDIPNGDGSLDYSYFTGEPHYSERTVTFTLFKKVDDATLQGLRQTLMSAYHGQIVNVYLPTDDYYYYTGTLQIGDLVGFNQGKIPCTLRAEPFRTYYQQSVTTISGSDSFSLINAGDTKQVPLIKTTAAATITAGGATVSLAANTNQLVPALTMPPHTTVAWSITSTGTTTITVQEKRF